MDFPLRNVNFVVSNVEVNWLFDLLRAEDDCFSKDRVFDFPGDFDLDLGPYPVQLLFICMLDPRVNFEIEDDDLVDLAQGGFVVVGEDVGLSEAVGIRSFGSER